jgi:cyclopropane fatty-acyl-phospholipid synthase-like methyltransferase
MTAAEFEARYRSNPDPWGYTSSPYEARKYAATLTACGAGRFDSALELGCSIGVFSARLAGRCRSLMAIDGAPSAIGSARDRLAGQPQAVAIQGAIPDDIPRRSYDLVVASEILYYLGRSELAGTLALLRDLMAPRARLVAVHWRPPGNERPFTADEVHARLIKQSWLEPVSSGDTEDYRLDILERW